MQRRVLVAYSSRTGTTAEIARSIGESLESDGWSAEVHDASEVKSVREFDLVVIGSPIYAGTIRESVLTFCEAHLLDLMQQRVAVFTVGILPVASMAAATGEHEGAVENVCLRAPGVNPFTHAIFAGAYDPDSVDFVSRKLMERKNALVGDFRDWDAIDAWASGLSEEMAA